MDPQLAFLNTYIIFETTNDFSGYIYTYSRRPVADPFSFKFNMVNNCKKKYQRNAQNHLCLEKQHTKRSLFVVQDLIKHKI